MNVTLTLMKTLVQVCNLLKFTSTDPNRLVLVGDSRSPVITGSNLV